MTAPIKNRNDIGSFPRRSDRRTLDTVDKFMYDMNSPLVLGHFSFEGGFFPKDDRLEIAFNKAISTTGSALLRSKIDPKSDENGYHQFVLLKDKKDWPKLTFIGKRKTDDEAVDAIVKINNDLAERTVITAFQGDKTLLGTSIHVHVARGPTQVVLGMACPHPFFDATSCGSLLGKIIAYYKLPRVFWPVLDRKQKKDLPTMLEMVMKGDMKSVDPKLLANPPKHDVDVFFFKGFNLLDPAASTHIRGVDKIIAEVPEAKISSFVKEVRTSGATLTTVFGALALKIYGTILMKYGLNDDKMPLAYTQPMDARYVGTWHDPKKDKKMKRFGFPAIANYGMTIPIVFSFEDVIDSPLLDLAGKIKTDLKRIHSDPEFRFRQFLKNIPSDLELLSRAVGCSCNSIRVPKSVFGAKFFNPPKALSSLKAEFEVGALPRIFFVVVSHPASSITQVRLIVKLPIADLTEAEIDEVTKEAIKGTPLEAILS